MRRFRFVAAIVVAFCLAAGAAVAGAPDNAIVIKANVKESKKPPVTFQHKTHADKSHGELKCVVCHHKGEPGKEQACTKCHGEKGEGKKLDTKEAFHKQCKGCHTDGKKGPTKCDECHKK